MSIRCELGVSLVSCCPNTHLPGWGGGGLGLQACSTWQEGSRHRWTGSRPPKSSPEVKCPYTWPRAVVSSLHATQDLGGPGHMPSLCLEMTGDFFFSCCKIHETKCSTWTIVSPQCGTLSYILLCNHHHHPSPGFFSPCKTETPYSLNTTSPFSASQQPGIRHSTSHLYKLGHSK